MTSLRIESQAQCFFSTGVIYSTAPCSSVDTVEASEVSCFLRIPNIPSRRYCLRSPMTIQVQKECGRYIVSQAETGVFAYADDVPAAMDSFYESFIHQYAFLKDNANRLSPSLKRDLQEFEKLVQAC
jgi:hypothetical protein